LKKQSIRQQSQIRIEREENGNLTQKATDLDTKLRDLTRENNRNKRQLQQTLNDQNQEREIFSEVVDKLSEPGTAQKIFD